MTSGPGGADRADPPAAAPGQVSPTAGEDSGLSCRDPQTCRRARKASLIAAAVMFLATVLALAIAAALSGGN